jgi:hypothetical protein
MHRLVRAATAASILAVTFATAAQADTGEPTTPFDRFTASAEGVWTDPTNGSAYDAGIEITHDTLGGGSTALFVFRSYDPTYVCDIGDPADPEDDIIGRAFSVTATATSGIDLTIGDRLSSAVASATVTGQEVWEDECNNVQTGATRTFQISVSTSATTPLVRSKDRTVEVLADGTKLTRTYGLLMRSAAGSFSVDGASSVGTGDIYEQTMAIRSH